jgi:methylaspartate mutase epsilon subunit
VAVSVLEALFFRQCGLHSISLSYAQQTSEEQDRQAVAALRRLAEELLPGADWHVVLHTYPGLFPASADGARRIVRDAALLAAGGGADRLIVRGAGEPETIEESVRALRAAARVAAEVGAGGSGASDNPVYAEARALIEAVLGLSADVGRGLVEAFRHGYLDVPYCRHPDNAGRSRSRLDADGRLVWCETGAMPIRRMLDRVAPPALTGAELRAALSYVQRRYDGEAGGASLARADLPCIDVPCADLPLAGLLPAGLRQLPGVPPG